MRKSALLLALAAGFLFVQCGKDKVTDGQVENRYGVSVELQPSYLPVPPAGMNYQAWIFRLQKQPSGLYSAQYTPFARFGWNSYAYKFTHPVSDTDLGRIFRASPDTTNLFTQNLTAFVRADTIGQVVEKLLRGQSVSLSGQSQNLDKLVGFLLSIEPKSSSPVVPSIPFLAAYSNDSGITDMIYPYNYRHPDFFVSYFMATPSDTLYNAKKITDTLQYRNEHRGVWFGFIDTSRYDLGIRMVQPDTVLRKLARELMPGWQFEGWIERNGTRVSLGHFQRGDSADLENPYAYIRDSVFSVPGEDFLINPPAEFSSVDKGVLNSTVMITLEPRPDNDPEMFPAILFRATTPARDSSIHNEGDPLGRNIHFNFDMENRARLFPKIKVRIIPEQR